MKRLLLAFSALNIAMAVNALQVVKKEILYNENSLGRQEILVATWNQRKKNSY
jgi:hypothetical protein